MAAPSCRFHCRELTLIARVQADDQVGFPKRIGLQDEAFAHSGGANSLAQQVWGVGVEAVIRRRSTRLCDLVVV